MKTAFLPAGKIPPELMERLLRRLRCDDPRVRVGPRLGEDAAVIDLGDRLLVAKTDPITFATERSGWYLVHINANDIACMGATPKWLLVSCLMPEKRTAPADLEALFDDLSLVCQELGITVCGGHTEVTLGLERPVLVGLLLGEASRGELVDKRRISSGDAILLTKGVAIEGTSLIARECAGLLGGRLAPEILERSRDLLVRPGISVLKDARVARRAAGELVHGMHDPTEGGLLQGVWELARRAGLGARLEWGLVPVLPETRALAEFFHLEPLGLLASGALLLVVDPKGEEFVREALAAEGIACARIGTFRQPQDGVKWIRDGVEVPSQPLPADELIKALGAR